jgi:4-aminobutyrate aminotransferase-like enzyme
VIEEEHLVSKVKDTGDYLMQGIKELAQKHPAIQEVRGLGLMIGVELGAIAKETLNLLLKKGIIANVAHDTVLRILPPFIISRNECDEFLTALNAVLQEIELTQSTQ